MGEAIPSRRNDRLGGMRWVAFAVAGVMASACGRVGFGPAADADLAGSGAADAADSGNAAGCYGSGLVVVCPLAPLPPTFGPGSGMTQTIDTANGSSDCLEYTGTTPGELCLIGGDTVRIDGTLRGVGPRPLVVLASDTLVIGATGVIDVASRAGSNGAGANSAACVAGDLPVAGDGGPGGTFGGRGGAGGDQGVAGGPTSAPVGAVTSLRGGCPGASGNGTAGVGGAGGGAVYLIAATSISVGNTITASGAGGRGGPGNGSGGGGGGSGGMIGLDAPSIVLLSGAEVFANGGGGGAGNASADGADASNPTAAAIGGRGSSADGGDGSVGTVPDGAAGTSSTQAGGGGGGGAGVIRVFPAQSLVGTVSPPAA